jgi:hypothetical protein
MARKAVQGFPEKSYYDNTRYLGMVATTDPLNEGLFKHLVNLDISDTGQSVQPRDGFLTTTLKNGVNLISLSNQTIIFKDNNINEYVIYDFKSNTGYIADVSSYNLQDKLLPIVSTIAIIDWSSFINVLRNQLNYINTYYNEVNGSDVVKLTETINYVKQYLTILPDTKVEHIYDENTTHKSLVKAFIKVPNQTEFKFIFQIFYRKDAVPNVPVFTANTLTLEVVDLFEHPTLVSTDRNLAVSKSIIPEVFQTLYTEQTRPDGHINNLGNFVYIYDDALNYVNNFIYRNTNYNIKPYFSLNPAYYNLNNDVNTSDKWAYKFELFNTSTEISDRTKNVLFSTPWMKYINDTTKPTEVFTTNNIQDNLISLGNTNKINNHYLGSKHIIFLVPKNPTTSTSEEIGGFEFQPVSLSESARTNIENIYNNWRNILSTIVDLKTLRAAINSLDSVAFFYMYNVHTAPSIGTFQSLDESMESEVDSAINSYSIPTTASSNFNIFLTGSELLTKIETEGVFRENYNITFKLLPYASKDTRAVTSNIFDFTSDSRFLTQAPIYIAGDPNVGSTVALVAFNTYQGSTLLANGNTSLLSVGMSITGTGVQPGTTISSIINGTSLTMSKPSAISGTLFTTFTFSTTLILPFNTRVQRTSNGQMYRQTASPEGNTYVTEGSTLGITRTFNTTNLSKNLTAGNTEGLVTGQTITGTNIPANTTISKIISSTSLEMSNNATGTGTGISITFSASLTFSYLNNLYHVYRDTRTDKYYRWQVNNNNTTSFLNIDNPGQTREEYRWFLATIRNWGGSTQYLNLYPNFIRQINYFDRHDTGFFKYDFLTGKYSLETSLNTLSFKFPGFPGFFSSYSVFGDQVPYYSAVNPNNIIEAVVGTYIQNSVTGVMYVRTGSTPKAWIILPINQVIPPPPAFIKGGYYFDQRTNRTYLWENASTSNGFSNGYFTEVGNYPLRIDLNGLNFFEKGITGIFYIRPYEESELLNENGDPKTYQELQTLKAVWSSTALQQTFNVSYGYDSIAVTYIEKQLTKEPLQIQNSNNLIVFEESILLTWYNNVLYISEVGRYYWFKAKNKLEFSEEIIKVLQYKTIILVFTTQHLYAVYRVETTVTQLNPATNQIEQNVTGVAWLKQIVLYNLLVSKEYADVIQVFNQMVLFYSADGQLYMIRPNTAIDSETRFTLQFFNKAVNDVLVNYPDYINERLASYNKQVRITKQQVKIKALVSINYIKMFYYVPGVITYVLMYDVLNNRYYVYDTLTFTNIYDKWFIESGDVYITEQNEKIYFTTHYVEPNQKDNHVDMTITNNFKKEGINALIDTGNLNLNNHLTKRFRDLHVVFKNLNSSNLLFNLETNIDEIIAKPFYNTQLEVQDIGGVSYFVPIAKANQNDLIELVDVNQISETATDVIKYSLTNNLFENNNILMDFSEYTSSKLLTHRTSILGMGKVFRLKLQFISKGLYKLQHFGIIYKERRI